MVPELQAWAVGTAVEGAEGKEADLAAATSMEAVVKEDMAATTMATGCKTLGDVNYYLGLHIERDVEKRWMRVHQKKYLEALAANFGKIEGSCWREGGQVPWPNSNCWTAILRGGTKASKGGGWSRTREALSHRLL
ncbi:hypothetical protein CLOP_g8219 [Closterium sp. NIES-67]|nr:hypothetical protein CLOP_g8219 [Closterium sp. NIES-67]